jgi:hypothetical protein
MVDCYWLLVAMFWGMIVGSSLASDGYLSRKDSGDADE